MQKRICPPVSTTSAASAALREYAGSLRPVRATGNCKITYQDQQDKDVTQSFGVRLWFESSDRYCLYGDVMFDPKGMSFAVNNGKYWVYAKMFNVYLKGDIDKNSRNYISNPAVFLDFLNPLDSGCNSVDMAASAGIHDILICRGISSCGQKRIFMDRCDHFVRKIEYYSCSDSPVLTVELDDYKKLAEAENLVFPRKLTYSYYQGQICVDRREIKLNSVKLWRPGEKQIEALFTPPEADILENLEIK
ncbi:MAG: hypothetical protein JW806_00630 [Sedimentisphaerales bacterium]|nr:hypothetical protein [Sedimentisphaerales bacterium]